MMLRNFFLVSLMLTHFYSSEQVVIDSIFIQHDSIIINNYTGDKLLGLHFHPIAQRFDVVWLNNNLNNCALTDSVNIDTSYTNIYDLKYNELTNKVAIIGERDNAHLLTCADVTGSIDSIKKICYYRFDGSGHVGYVNNQNQFIYRHYNGTEITVNNIDPDSKIKINALDSATSMQISVVISPNGYKLFDLSKNAFISDYYDTIYYFQTDVFYAKKQNQYTLLQIKNGNVDATSKYDNIKVIDGHKPCLDIYLNDSTHLLFIDHLHIDTLKNFYSNRGDSLMGYKYEDSILLCLKNIIGYKAIYFVASLTDEVLNLDTVYRFQTVDTIVIYPFYKNYYLSKRGENGIYLTNLNDYKEYLSADDRKEYFKIENPYNQIKHYFFYISNNHKNKTSTLLITTPHNKNSVRSLDVSTASNKASGYVAFGDNILALKDDLFSLDGKTIGGWKLIDGYKACYDNAVQILDGVLLPDNRFAYAWRAKMRPFPTKLMTNIESCGEYEQNKMFAIIEEDKLRIIRVNYSAVDESTKTENSSRSKNQHSKKKNK